MATIFEVRECNRLGKSHEALNLLQNVESKDRYYFYEKAKCYLGLKEYKAAIVEIDKVIEQKRDWVGAYSIKVKSLYKLKKFDSIAPVIIDLINNSARSKDRVQAFPVVFNDMLDYRVPEMLVLLGSILEYYRFKLGADDVYCFYRAIVDSNTGKLAEASDNFKKVSSFSFFGRHSTGALSFRYGDDLKDVVSSESIRDVSSKIHFHDKSLAGFEFDSVVFVSCDDGYFNIFSDLLLASFSRVVKQKVFHMHLINPSSEVIEKCESFSDFYDFFNFSSEYKEDAEKIDYACLRYIRLPDVLSHYRRTVLVCDMDSCFVSDFDANGLLGGGQVAIKSDDVCSLHYFPWRSYIASFVLFSFSEKVVNLALDISKFLLHFVSRRDDDYWYVDQTALFCLLNFYAENNNFAFQKIHQTSGIVLVPEARQESKEEFVEKMLSKYC